MAVRVEILDDNPFAVVESIATTIGVDAEKKDNSSRLFVPDEIGEGCIQLRDFRNGISVLDVRINLYQDVDLCFEQKLLHPLKIIINRKARLKHWFNDQEEPAYLNEQGSITMASVARQKHIINLPKNQEISLLSIRINRREFTDSIEVFIEDMDPKLATIFRDINGVNSFFYEGYFDFQTVELLERYFNCTYGNIIENLYLEGLVYQLMSIQLDSLSKESRLDDNELDVSRNFQGLILKGARDLRQDISRFTSVADLAENLGLNTKKLQKGFQLMFGKTVLEYVNDIKLDRARKYLLTTDLTVAEIAYKLGVSSPAYLSKIFKKKFHLSPKEFRTKHSMMAV